MKRLLSPKLELPLSTKELPWTVMFRSARLPAQAFYPLHRHAWGEFVYSFSGVMEVTVADQPFLAPPQYGIWLPPDVEHVALNRLEAHHGSVYVARRACGTMPSTACALTVTPLVRALLEFLSQQAPSLPPSAADARLLQVLLDQLSGAPRASSYLPHSEDALLAPLLRALHQNPSDTRTLAEMARAAHTTERTLMRRCQRELGMSLAEWRQRLRVLKALPRLEKGHKVESIALDLGYASASAFIVMFRRHMKLTPEEFRQHKAA